MNWAIAASLPVAALTPYHALNRAGLSRGESLVVFGASGNTGMFATQVGKQRGAKVFAVSSKDWVTDLGADRVFGYSDAKLELEEATGGLKADVVLNSIGEKTWGKGIDCLGVNGRLVSFGALTGSNVALSINALYSNQQKIIGSTGGTRKEFKDLVSLSRNLDIKVWRVFSLEEGAEALRALTSAERDGRIMIRP